MTTLALPLPITTALRRKARRPRRLRRDLVLYGVLVLLVLGAWYFSRLGLYKSGDNVGYWLGVAGGVMMLLLLSYPLRKYLRFTHRWGKVKWWFVVHMVLGIGGPTLILLHSTFHLRSLNGTVALVSMLIVACSGVVGRFLYLHVHKGLNGERTNLTELQRKAGLAEGEMKLRLRFAPEVAEHLLAFEAQALADDRGFAAALRRVVLLPMRQRAAYRACSRDITERLTAIAAERGWTTQTLRRRRRQAVSLTRRYLLSVVRVAQLSAYVRLFALWHMLHVPFLYLLIVTACFHVFAVHAY
jgi:hypothetical protein